MKENGRAMQGTGFWCRDSDGQSYWGLAKNNGGWRLTKGGGPQALAGIRKRWPEAEATFFQAFEKKR